MVGCGRLELTLRERRQSSCNILLVPSPLLRRRLEWYTCCIERFCCSAEIHRRLVLVFTPLPQLYSKNYCHWPAELLSCFSTVCCISLQVATITTLLLSGQSLAAQNPGPSLSQDLTATLPRSFKVDVGMFHDRRTRLVVDVDAVSDSWVGECWFWRATTLAPAAPQCSLTLSEGVPSPQHQSR